MAKPADSCLIASGMFPRFKVSTRWRASVICQDRLSACAQHLAASTHLQLCLMVVLGPVHVCLSLVAHSCMGSLGLCQVLGICLQLFVEAGLCLCSSKLLLPLLRRLKPYRVSETECACLTQSMRLQVGPLTLASLQVPSYARTHSPRVTLAMAVTACAPVSSCAPLQRAWQPGSACCWRPEAQHWTALPPAGPLGSPPTAG